MARSREENGPSQRLDLGQPVEATDGSVGEVLDVVIDPVGKSVSHLVVGPHRHHQEARLLAIDQVTPAADGTLTTPLSSAEVDQLPTVEERDFFRLPELPKLADGWNIGITEVLAQPYNALYFEPDVDLGSPTLVDYDRIPAGEVEIRRLSPVTDRDGQPAGHVESFLVDEVGHITHVVIDRGHLWTHREITVPVSAAHRVKNDEVKLDLTIEELADLPTVRYHPHL